MSIDILGKEEETQRTETDSQKTDDIAGQRVKVKQITKIGVGKAPFFVCSTLYMYAEYLQA